MSDDTEGQKPDTETEVESEATEEVKKDAAKAPDETETQSESSTEEKSDSETEEEESEQNSKKEQDDESEEKTVDSSTKEPKLVEGETPRERALRLEVQRLRGERREQRVKELFGKAESAEDTTKVVEQKTSRLKELEKKFNPEEVKNFREALEAAAEDLGFVRKGDLQVTAWNQNATTVLDSFVEKHPEYLPENDKDDVLWKQFQVEFALYRKPDDARKLTKIFERIHRASSQAR